VKLKDCTVKGQNNCGAVSTSQKVNSSILTSVAFWWPFREASRSVPVQH